MDNRNILNLKRDVREMQLQHNRLTALCAILLKNMRNLRAELNTFKSFGGVANTSSSVNHNTSQFRQAKDMNELHADEILRQLSQQGN